MTFYRFWYQKSRTSNFSFCYFYFIDKIHLWITYFFNHNFGCCCFLVICTSIKLAEVCPTRNTCINFLINKLLVRYICIIAKDLWHSGKKYNHLKHCIFQIKMVYSMVYLLIISCVFFKWKKLFPLHVWNNLNVLNTCCAISK